jgi:hypothetical protein
MSYTVCSVNPPGHDWKNGLTCDWCWETRTVTEAILSQLSSRRGGDPASARQLLDAYRAEVVAETTAPAEAYPGELAMLHGLIATLRVVAEHGDLRQVRKLLEEHKADDAAARAETVTAPAGPTGRVAQLLDAIRTGRGRWTTVTAFRFYRDHIRSLDHIPNTQLRAVARGDLRDLTAWGHLARHEEPGRQYYTLKTPKDGAS